MKQKPTMLTSTEAALSNELVLRHMLHSHYRQSHQLSAHLAHAAAVSVSPVLSRSSSPLSSWMTTSGGSGVLPTNNATGGIPVASSASTARAVSAALMDEYVSQVLRTEALARSIYELEHTMSNTSSNIHLSNGAAPIKRAVHTKFSYRGGPLRQPVGLHPSAAAAAAAVTARRPPRTVAPSCIKPLSAPPKLPNLAPWNKVPEEQQQKLHQQEQQQRQPRQETPRVA